MNKWTCLVLLCAVATVGKADKDSLEVTTAQGPVRGHRDSSGDLFVFYGIPYATAPTGKDKFKTPLPPPTWTKPFDAVDKVVVCPQVIEPYMPENISVQEDCLVANVYVPDTKKKNLPVIVYVHGGAFQFGLGEWLKKKNLMKNKDIIFVNFNYRLGIHGFLCLGTEDVPGNAGMKDQVALLRWLQQNIAAFGGNPKDVTIAGFSAGSASVDLIMLSKSAEGLYHKVIPESGANLAVFTVQLDPLQNAKDHARKLNFTNVEDIYDLEEFYKTLSYDIMAKEDFMDRPDSTLMFVPCVEREGDGAFLTESPLSILTRGDYNKVPLLYGFASMEGILRTSFFDVWKDGMNEKFSDFLPADLKFETEDEKEDVAKQVKQFYFGDKPVDKDNIIGYVDYFSDIMFSYATLRAVKLHAEAGHDQVYLYEYSFVDDNTPVIPYTYIRGADHGAQSFAVGDGVNVISTSEDEISDELRNMKKIIREMWLNFIRTGKPVPKGSTLPTWPAAGPDRSPHMSLGQKVELRGVLLEERTKFWDNIYQKHYREPIPPPQPPHRTHAEL